MSLNSTDIEKCQKAVLDFLPPPVTSKQQKTLEKYQSGDLKRDRADESWGGDYERCLCSLIAASEGESDVEALKLAAEAAIKYAGAADGSELYAMLREILPNEFADASADDS